MFRVYGTVFAYRQGHEFIVELECGCKYLQPVGGSDGEKGRFEYCTCFVAINADIVADGDNDLRLRLFRNTRRQSVFHGFAYCLRVD
jgi:hypothetical protein